jgi:hypothetical protein
VSAQRTAAETGNVRLMSGLADQLDALITDIDGTGRRLGPVYQLVAGGQVDGPRVQAIRDMMTAVTADAALAQASVRRLTLLLITRRDETRKEFDSISASTPAAFAGTAAGRSSPSLIDTRR